MLLPGDYLQKFSSLYKEQSWWGFFGWLVAVGVFFS